MVKGSCLSHFTISAYVLLQGDFGLFTECWMIAYYIICSVPLAYLGH